MIPYKIVGTTNFRPYVAFFVTVTNVVAFVYICFMPSWVVCHWKRSIANYVLDVCAIGKQSMQETLIDGMRSIFLHMSFVHLTSNIIIFYVFGSRIEEHLGRMKFLAFYLIAGFGGHLGHFLFDGGQCAESLYMIGSSGAVSGVIGAFLFLFPAAPHKIQDHFSQGLRLRYQVPAWIYLCTGSSCNSSTRSDQSPQKSMYIGDIWEGSYPAWR